MINKFLLFLCLCGYAWGTTTVSGNLKNLGTGAVTTGSFVRFYLRGCGGNLPRVNGTAIIAPTLGNVFYFDFVPNSSGAISGTLYSTRDSTGLLAGDIECGGSNTAVWYGFVPFLNGKAGPETPIHAKNTGTIDISNITPITSNPVITAPTGDSTYMRLDAGNSPATGAWTFPAATITGAFTVGSAANSSGSITSNDLGVYTNTQENEYLQSLLNSCVPGTEWTNIGQSGFTTNAISGCNAVPAAATAVQAAGVAGWVNNLSTTTNAVGVYGQARALATGAHTWGGNDITSDAGFAAVMQGHEVDCNISNAGSTGQCLDINGNFSAQPSGNTFAAIRIFKPGANQFTSGIDFKDGAVVGGTAMNLAVSTTGNNQFSQLISLTSRDSGGTTHATSFSNDPNGNFQIRPGTGTTQFQAGSAAMQTVEAAAPSGVASSDVFYADSTAHRWKMNNNNGGAQSVAGFLDNLSVFAAGGTITPATVTSNAANPAASGFVRRANTDLICSRDNANGSDHCFGEIQHIRGVAGCTTGNAAGNTCGTTLNWPTAFADSNYTVSCTGVGVGAGTPVLSAMTTRNTAGVVINTMTVTAVASSFTTVECTGIHD